MLSALPSYSDERAETRRAEDVGAFYDFGRERLVLSLAIRTLFNNHEIHFRVRTGEKNMPLLNAVIDISHHNNVTSFQDVKDAGIIGVINKATQGTTGVDGTYGLRKPRALAAGLLWGGYHFASKGNPQKQADHFLDVTQPGPTDLLVLDFEPNSHDGTMTVAEAETLGQRILPQNRSLPRLLPRHAIIQE